MKAAIENYPAICFILAKRWNDSNGYSTDCLGSWLLGVRIAIADHAAEEELQLLFEISLLLKYGLRLDPPSIVGEAA